VKFRVYLKDPDVLHEAIDDAMEKDPSLVAIADSDEREAVEKIRREKLHELCRQWFEYAEYLTVEVDTEAKTCTVVPVGK
jgi:hypothetical protein